VAQAAVCSGAGAERWWVQRCAHRAVCRGQAEVCPVQVAVAVVCGGVQAAVPECSSPPAAHP